MEENTYKRERWKVEMYSVSRNCHWCGRFMSSPSKWREFVKLNPGAKPPENLATIDHLNERGTAAIKPGTDKVLACMGCNHKRGEEYDRQIQSEGRNFIGDWTPNVFQSAWEKAIGV